MENQAISPKCGVHFRLVMANDRSWPALFMNKVVLLKALANLNAGFLLHAFASKRRATEYAHSV